MEERHEDGIKAMCRSEEGFPGDNTLEKKDAAGKLWDLGSDNEIQEKTDLERVHALFSYQESESSLDLAGSVFPKTNALKTVEISSSLRFVYVRKLEMLELEMLKLKMLKLKIHCLESPWLEMTKLEMLKLQMLKLEMRWLEMPWLKMTKLEMLKLEMLKLEMRWLEMPWLEMTKLEMLKLQMLKLKMRWLEMPWLEMTKLEMLKLQILKLEMRWLEIPWLKMLKLEILQLKMRRLEMRRLEMRRSEMCCLEMRLFVMHMLEILLFEKPWWEMPCLQMHGLQMHRLEMCRLEMRLFEMRRLEMRLPEMDWYPKRLRKDAEDLLCKASAIKKKVEMRNTVKKTSIKEDPVFWKTNTSTIFKFLRIPMFCSLVDLWPCCIWHLTRSLNHAKDPLSKDSVIDKEGETGNSVKQAPIKEELHKQLMGPSHRLPFRGTLFEIYNLREPTLLEDLLCKVSVINKEGEMVNTVEQAPIKEDLLRKFSVINREGETGNTVEKAPIKEDLLRKVSVINNEDEMGNAMKQAPINEDLLRKVSVINNEDEMGNAMKQAPINEGAFQDVQSWNSGKRTHSAVFQTSLCPSPPLPLVSLMWCLCSLMYVLLTHDADLELTLAPMPRAEGATLIRADLSNLGSLAPQTPERGRFPKTLNCDYKHQTADLPSNLSVIKKEGETGNTVTKAPITEDLPSNLSVIKKEGETGNTVTKAPITEGPASDDEQGRASSKRFSVDRGVHQGTPLAATLFNFFVNGLIEVISATDDDVPKLGKINAVPKMSMDCVLSPITFFLLICCSCVSADFVTLTQDSPVVVELGDTAVLYCHTSIPDVLYEVRWVQIQGGHYSIINIFKDGKDQQRCDRPEYVGRTELMKEDLAQGRAALKVFNVSVTDESTYRCYLGTVDYFDFGDLELRVTALGSDPRIDIEGFQDGGIKAVCRSGGWYPEPTLVNKDDDGNMTIQKENGFYSIEYSRIIMENSNQTFSCRLRTPFPNQERETSVYLADDLFQKRTDSCIRIVMYTLIAVLLLAAVVALFISRTCQKRKQDATSPGNTEALLLKVPLEKS